MTPEIKLKELQQIKRIKTITKLMGYTRFKEIIIINDRIIILKKIL